MSHDIETNPTVQIAPAKPPNVAEREDVELTLGQIEDAASEVETPLWEIEGLVDELCDLEDLPEEVAADVRMHAEDFRGEVDGLANQISAGIRRLRKQLTALELGPEKTEASDDDAAICAGAVTTDFSKIPVAAISDVVSAFIESVGFEDCERLQRCAATIEEWLNTVPPKIRCPHLDHGSEPA